MNADEPNPTDLERRLAAWLPAAQALDRDRVLFEAGRASARANASRRAWPCAVAGLAIVLAALGGLFARERSQRLALETTVAVQSRLLAEPHRQVIPQAPSVEQPGPSSYLVLTARLSSGELDLSPDPSKSDAEQAPVGPQPPTLRPRSFERAFDL